MRLLHSAQRLKKNFEFRRIYTQGKKIPGKYINIHLIPTLKKRPRLGVTLSKSYGNAVRRNAFKRYARESFRHLQDNFEGYEVVIQPKKGKLGISLLEIREDLCGALKTL